MDFSFHVNEAIFAPAEADSGPGANTPIYSNDNGNLSSNIEHGSHHGLLEKIRPYPLKTK